MQPISSVISTIESRILVLIEPTNEQWIAASHANEIRIWCM